MNQSAIAQAPIQYFALDRLYLSPMNPREGADPDSLRLLAQSIKVAGLIQNLAGHLDDDGRVGIVAGGRRLRAMSDLSPEDRAEAGLAEIPVRIAPDEATARAWASIENTAREALHPADEIRAYGRMAGTGSDVPAIARVFGQSEAHVYRRLALAALPAHATAARTDPTPRSPRALPTAASIDPRVTRPSRSAASPAARNARAPPLRPVPTIACAAGTARTAETVPGATARTLSTRRSVWTTSFSTRRLSGGGTASHTRSREASSTGSPWAMAALWWLSADPSRTRRRWATARSAWSSSRVAGALSAYHPWVRRVSSPRAPSRSIATWAASTGWN